MDHDRVHSGATGGDPFRSDVGLDIGIHPLLVQDSNRRPVNTCGNSDSQAASTSCTAAASAAFVQRCVLGTFPASTTVAHLARFAPPMVIGPFGDDHVVDVSPAVGGRGERKMRASSTQSSVGSSGRFTVVLGGDLVNPLDHTMTPAFDSRSIGVRSARQSYGDFSRFSHIFRSPPAPNRTLVMLGYFLVAHARWPSRHPCASCLL